MDRIKTILFAVLVALIAYIPGNFGSASASIGQYELVLEVPVQAVEIRQEDPVQDGTELDIVVVNAGKVPIEAYVVTEGPPEWQPSLFHKFKMVSVDRLSLEVGERSEDLKFRFVVPLGIENGKYAFEVKFSAGDVLVSRAEFVVDVNISREIDEEEPEYVQRLTGGFEFDTKFAKRSSQAGLPVHFRANIRSRDLADINFRLDAATPLGWKVAFKPSFQIGDIRALVVPSGHSAILDVLVTAPSNVIPGVHSIVLKAIPDNGSPLEIPIEVEIKGVAELRLATESDLLTVGANAGHTTEMKILMVNSGQGSADNIRFVTQMPPGWGITIDSNPMPRIEAGETVVVNLSVTPPDKTIPGKYQFRLLASVDEQRSDLSVSVMVERSNTFAFLGIGLIVLVVLSLGGIFLNLSRS